MDAWRRAAQAIGGSFEEAAGSSPLIRRRAGVWDIVMQRGILEDQAGKMLNDATLLTAPVVNSAGLEFTVYRERFFHGLFKLYGFQDIQVGDSEFDRAFICKGNDEEKLRQVFAGARLKSLMLAAPNPMLTLSSFRPTEREKMLKGAAHEFLPFMAADMEAFLQDKLQYCSKGILEDADTIKGLFELFDLLLARLSQLGIARPLA